MIFLRSAEGYARKGQTRNIKLGKNSIYKWKIDEFQRKI
jgi:hypothetical protein